VWAKVGYYDDEQTASTEVITVDGQPLVFVFHSALADYQEEYAQYEASKMSAYSVGHVTRSYAVQERVEWLTPLGTPKLHANRSVTTFLKYFRR
jgi:hypothetical protein